MHMYDIVFALACMDMDFCMYAMVCMNMKLLLLLKNNIDYNKLHWLVKYK